MLRRLLLPAFLIGFAAPGLVAPSLVAQDGPTANRIYIATYKISFADIPEWSQIYSEHSVPVLEGLVEEGLITGFNVRMHHTGGEYNIRQGILGHEGTDFDAFWEAYLGGLAEANADAFERWSRMIQAHADEIWNLDVVSLGDGGGGAQYFYEAKFQVNFADMDVWNGMWEEKVFPVVERLMADGLLNGYVVQGHNTGGRFNWKVGWLYDEWDNFDEIEGAIFEAVPLDDPLWRLFSAHQDELWQALPPS